VLLTTGAAGASLTGAVTADHLSRNSETDSAWDRPTAWRTSRPDFRPTVALSSGGELAEIEARIGEVTVDDVGQWHVVLDGIQHTARVFSDARDRSIWVSSDRGIHVFTRPQADTSLTPGLGGAEVLAPMPGSVVAIRVESGDHVDAGAPIVVIEAMKMEHVLTAPATGIVTVTAVQGTQVGLDEVLATVVDEESEQTATPADEPTN